MVFTFLAAPISSLLILTCCQVERIAFHPHFNCGLFPSDLIQPILAHDPAEQMDHVFDSHVKTLCKADLEI